ncbi:MAG: MFS transporter [Hyphomicrobiaceae bacterium]|nr:MFS transporter [Hyphomicrobiaceae bacterium]
MTARLYGHLAEGLVLATSFLPAAGVIPFAGRIIRRFGVWRVLFASKIMNALLALALLGAWSTGSPWAVFGVNMLFSTSVVFFIVGSGVILPKVVGFADLHRANILTNLAPSAMMIAGGVFIVFSGNAPPASTLFFVVAGGFVLSALAFWRVRLADEPEQSDATPEDPHDGHGLRHGIAHLLQNTMLLRAFLLRLTIYIGAGAQVLLTIFAEDVFEWGRAGIGLLVAARGLGIFVGPITVQRWAGHVKRQTAVVFGIALLGFGYAGAALAASYGIWAAAVVFVFGFAGTGTVRVLTMAALQERCEPRHLPHILGLEQGVTAVVQSTAAIVIGAAVSQKAPHEAIVAAIIVGALLIAAAAAWHWSTSGTGDPRPKQEPGP